MSKAKEDYDKKMESVNKRIQDALPNIIVDVTPWKVVDGKFNVPFEEIKRMNFDVFSRARAVITESGVTPSSEDLDNIRVIINRVDEKVRKGELVTQLEKYCNLYYTPYEFFTFTSFITNVRTRSIDGYGAFFDEEVVLALMSFAERIVTAHGCTADPLPDAKWYDNYIHAAVVSCGRYSQSSEIPMAAIIINPEDLVSIDAYKNDKDVDYPDDMFYDAKIITCPFMPVGTLLAIPKNMRFLIDNHSASLTVASEYVYVPIALGCK